VNRDLSTLTPNVSLSNFLIVLIAFLRDLKQLGDDGKCSMHDLPSESKKRNLKWPFFIISYWRWYSVEIEFAVS
jgi:hypothetical protein